MPPKNIENKEESKVEETKVETPNIGDVVASLQQELADLKEQMVRGVPTKKLKRSVEHTAKIMFYEDLPVVKFGNAYNKVINDDTKLYIEITTRDKDGKEKKHEVDYITTFNESLRVACLIKKVNKNIIEKPQGNKAQQSRVSVMKADPAGVEGGNKDFSRRVVDLLETVEESTVDIVINEGEWAGTEMTLPIETLNP